MNELKMMIEFAGMSTSAAAKLTGTTIMELETALQGACDATSERIMGRLSAFLLRKWSGKGLLDSPDMMREIAARRSDVDLFRRLDRVTAKMGAA